MFTCTFYALIPWILINRFLSFLRLLDPRQSAIRHYRIWASIFLALFLVGIKANWEVIDLRGGILDDALPPDNIYRQMNESVKNRSPDFHPEEIVPIVIKLDNSSNEAFIASLLKVVELTERAKAGLSKNVLSLADIADYRDTGTQLLDDPYLTRDKLTSGTFDVEAFKQRVSQDSSVYGLLIDRSWKWASIGYPLPPNYNEVKEAWKIVEFLEQRHIPWWERMFLKTDVYPSILGLLTWIGLAGWVMGRWLIDQCLNRDMLVLPTLGLCISFYFFRKRTSLRQCLIALLVNVVAGIWFTRGSIWPVHVLIWAVYCERVYSILAYANVIVQGNSFSLHKFNAFRRAKGAMAQERFIEAMETDGKINLVAIVAILAFGALNAFPIWQMQEMGYQSMMGVFTVWVGATVFTPAVYLTLEELLGPENLPIISEEPQQNLITRLKTMKIPAWVRVSVGLGIPFSTLGLGIALFLIGKIPAGTTPLDYIKGTLVETTSRFLADAGSGNEFLDIHVASKKNLSIMDPEFIQLAARFQNDLDPNHGFSRFEAWQKEKGLKPVLGFKSTGSILGKVGQISRESYKRELPTQKDQLQDIFFLMNSGFTLENQEQLWYSHGLRVIALSVINDSVQWRTTIERLLAFAQTEYPELEVEVFNKIPVYPQVDWYITLREPLNLALSFGFVALCYGIWLGVRNRRQTVQLNPWLGALIMLLPFIFSVGVMAMIMAWRHISLSMSTAPIADLAINAASDFGVYITAGFMAFLALGMSIEEAIAYAILLEGPVVATDCVLNIAAFAPLYFSQFEPVREVAWMTSAMLVSCFIGAVVFIPLALPLAVRKPRIVPAAIVLAAAAS